MMMLISMSCPGKNRASAPTVVLVGRCSPKYFRCAAATALLCARRSTTKTVVLHDLVPGEAEVVENLIEVGERLSNLCGEVVRVDEVALVVVRQLPGDVDRLADLDRLSFGREVYLHIQH